jgi:hypothetical protein
MLLNDPIRMLVWFSPIVDEIFQRGLLRGGARDVRRWNTYLHVLLTLSITDTKASDRAEEILKEMIRLKIANSISFAITLRALAKGGRPDRAQAVLERLVGRIILSAEEWLLCTSLFQLHFQVCYALRFQNTWLINQLYSRSQ